MSSKKIILALIPGLLIGGWIVVERMTESPRSDTQVTAMPASDPAVDAAASESRMNADAASTRSMTLTASDGFRLADGKVDAHLRNAQLAATVAKIAGASGVELAGGEYLPDATIQLDLDAVPVAEALLRLTVGYDSAFEYRDSRLVRMSIGPQQESRSEEAAQATMELPADFEQLDPEQRGDRIESIAVHGGEAAHAAIDHALADADESVRLRALEQTQVVKGLALPTDELQTVLLQDASETVRLKALDVLATDPRLDAATLAMIAGKAGSDPSEQIRTSVAVLRQRLESAGASAPQ